MLSWPFFLKKNGTRRKSPLRTIREFALACSLYFSLSSRVAFSLFSHIVACGISARTAKPRVDSAGQPLLVGNPLQQVRQLLTLLRIERRAQCLIVLASDRCNLRQRLPALGCDAKRIRSPVLSIPLAHN